MLVDQIINKVRNTQQFKHTIKVDVESPSYARMEVFRYKKKIESTSLAASELIDDGLDANDV